MSRFFLVSLLLCAVSSADDTVPRFETHVRRILKEHCWHCHGEGEQLEGNLDLRLVRHMLRGGESGPAVVAGQAEASLLLQRIRDGEMPPDPSKRLSPEDISAIGRWINAGARTARPEPDTISPEGMISEEEKSHWSFQPLRRPVIPQTSANPIDAFLLRRLQSEFPDIPAEFSPRAAPHTLLRRVFLDLHGVLPTPRQLDELVQSASSVETWPDIVNRLLSSPKYGERWARHWLDTAGYADSEGYNEADQERPHAWRYRDYVIRSLNEDKPFDRFIIEQLAGDELITSPLSNLTPQDAELLTATGFLRMAPDGTGGSVPDAGAARNETIADTIRIVTSSLMGLTVGCAQCHNHRYDPISQADYYRLRAIFEPAFNWKSWRSPAQRRISLYTREDREKAAEIEAKAKAIDEQRTARQKEFIQATFEKQVSKIPAELHELARAAHKTPAGKRTPEQKSLLRRYPALNVTAGSLYLYDRKAADTLAALADQAKELRSQKPKENFVRALTEVPGQVPPTFVFKRGDHEQPGEKVQPAGLRILTLTTGLPDLSEFTSGDAAGEEKRTDLPDTTQSADSPAADRRSASSGRRLAFARRLTDARHPLTARVIVNRVWMHHFGRGLVHTPADFGLLGQPPSHPDLLDWLATEFIESGWSLKHLHRLILTSEAWQQRTLGNSRIEEADADNVYYARARLRRLDAEVIRDCMLQISGDLNEKPYGPPVPVMADRAGRFVIGKENLNAGRPGKEIDMKEEQYRRSIYIQVRRSRPLSLLSTFDLPQMSPNCEMRRPTTTSTQSLMMVNSDQIIAFSERTAQRVLQQAGPEASDQIRQAWLLIYTREPEPSEAETAGQFLKDQAEIFRKQNPSPDTRQQTAEKHALAVMCQMLFSSNEFLYID